MKTTCKLILFFGLISIVFGFQSKDPEVDFTRTIELKNGSLNSAFDTLGVTLSFQTSGEYDTIWMVDTTFDTSYVPSEILLSFDLSASMGWSDAAGQIRLTSAKLAAINLIDNLHPKDKISILGWTASRNLGSLSDTTSSYYRHVTMPLTRDFEYAKEFIRDSLYIDVWRSFGCQECLRSELTEYIDGETFVVVKDVPFGNYTSTPLYISSLYSFDYFNMHAEGTSKAVIILTDGVNYGYSNQSYTLQNLNTMSQSSGTKGFTIAFNTEDSDGFLQRAADTTGGEFYFADNQESLEDIYNIIQQSLISQNIDTSHSTTPIVVRPDTVTQPADILLAFDLSGSMKETDNSGRWRITWAQISALKFLSDMRPEDRIGILGWTASSRDVTIADTADGSLFYHVDFPFSNDAESAKAFVRDSLFLDGSEVLSDTYENEILMKQSPIPGGFGWTPLFTSVVYGSDYLNRNSTNPNKVLIVLTDGENTDGMTFDETKTYISDNFDTTGTRVFTIGFNGGDSAVLHDLAVNGRGKFYNAQNPDELDNAYADLMQTLFFNLAARNLTIQEGLAPNFTLIPGSQSVLPATTVPVLGYNSSTDGDNQTILTWNFDHLPIFSDLYLYYEVEVDNSDSYIVGLDVNHSLNDNYSQAEFLNINLDSTLVYLPIDSIHPGDRIVQCNDIDCDQDILDSIADEIGIPADSLGDSVDVPVVPPDTVIVGPGDTVIVNPGDTVVVDPDTIVAGPGDTVIVNPGDTIVIGPGDTVIVTPGDTIVAGPTDTIIIVPGDTVITESGDTVVINPGDTIVVGPSDTIVIVPDPIVIVGPPVPDPPRIVTLDLSDLGLDSIPSVVGGLTDLEDLDLSNNELVELGPVIENLDNLINLDLSYNKLVDFPEEIDNMDLNNLDLSHNLIDDFPQDIENLKVDSLNLSHNLITNIPSNIGNLEVTNLDLSNNNITEIPAELELISGLEYVDLSNNNLETLPANLPGMGLTLININNNKLCELTPEEEAWLDDIASDLNWRATQDCPFVPIMVVLEKQTRVYLKSQYLHIDFIGYPGIKNISIYNIKGKNVYQSSGNKNRYFWDIQTVPRGVYYIQLTAPDLKKVQKILVP